MTSQDPVTSKSHTFQNHYGDVRSRLRARRDRPARTDRLLFLGIFRTVPQPFPVSLFLSFFLSFWDWEVSAAVSFFLSHFSFCLCSGISALLWLASRFPSSLFPPLNISFPWKNTHAWRVLTAGWFLRHMYSLTKWKCDTESSYVRIQASDGCKFAFEAAPLLEDSKPAAHRSRDVGGREAGIHAYDWKQQEPPLPHCRFEQSRKAGPSLWTDKAKPPCACRFASTSNRRPLDLRWWHWTRNFPRRHSHLEQERSGDRILGPTAAPWLKKIRSDSDDMVRQKSSKKQVQTTKVTCWWSPRCWRCKFAIEEVCGPHGQENCMATRTRAWACYGTPWQQLGRFRDVYSPRGAKKNVFLQTSSTVTLLEKNHSRNVEQFWNLAGIFLDYQRIIQS